MKLKWTIPALAAGVLAIAPGPASAAPGERVRVCADRLELNREPNQGWDGALREGQSFRRHSESGRYAYGFAYGDINRLGWVRTAGLCGADEARDAVAARLVGERVAVVGRVRVGEEPNGRRAGSLQAPETFAVRRLSPSGKYAFGFAYGEATPMAVSRRGFCARHTEGCGATRLADPTASTACPSSR